MVTREAVLERNKRLEGLKQSAILKNLAEINLDNEIELYQTIIENLVNGQSDEVFYSPYLNDLTHEEKIELMKLVRDYSFLCFRNGNYNNWTDSVLNGSLVDLDYICGKILDNYNLLIRLARDGGKNVLNLLRRFSELEEYKESSVIDCLRNNFADDNILCLTLIEMSRNDSLYNMFSVEELAKLCTVPSGVLYFIGDDNDSLEFTSPLSLAREFFSRDPDADTEDDSFENIVKTVLYSKHFDDILLDIQLDTFTNPNEYRKRFTDSNRDMSYSESISSNRK